MRVDDGGGPGPNYWPNSLGGPAPDASVLEPSYPVDGEAGRFAYTHPNNDFDQPGELYRKALTDKDREHLVGNIVSHLSGAIVRIQKRQCALFYKADATWGEQVAAGLGLDKAEIKKLAELPDEKRIAATAT